MKSFVSSLLASLLLIGLSIATFYHFFLENHYKGQNTFHSIIQYCTADGSSEVDASLQTKYFKTSIGPFDSLTCILSTFTHLVSKGREGAFFFKLLLNAYLGIMFYVAVESTRSTAKLFLFTFSLIFLLCNIVGISISIPLLWMPSYLLLSTNGKLNQGKVYNVAAIFYVIILFMMHFSDIVDSYGDLFGIYVFAFTYCIPFFSWVWYLLPAFCGGPSIPENGGSYAAVSAFNFFSGVLAIEYAIFIKPYIFSYSTIVSIFEASFKILKDGSTNEVAHFVIVECIVIWLAWFIFISANGGFTQSLSFATKTLLMGPGSAILLFASWSEKQSTNVKLKTQ